MRKIFLVGLLTVILAACSAGVPQQTNDHTVTVYKSPTWGCCGDWGDYLEQNGFTVKEINIGDLSAIKAQNNVPAEFQSCHTAIVDGYVIEGHVPAAEINRLLSERPDVLGLAVPGMPNSSPGMDVATFDEAPFDVVTFDKQGNTTIYASYPKK